MNWTALVPIKHPADRKRRLSDRLDDATRAAVAEQLFRHVVTVLQAVPMVSSIVALSPLKPEISGIDWREDRGRGLNVELEAARAALRPQAMCVIHADLPLLSREEVDQLLAAAEMAGVAIAPDRHGSGTNALAVTDHQPLQFQFGPGSLALHRAQAGEACRIVTLPGLALDIDTAADLDLAIAGGFRPTSLPDPVY